MPRAATEERSSLPTIHIRRKRVAIPLVSLVLIGTTALAGWAGYELIPGFADWLRGRGDLAPWAFALAFAIALVFMGPAGVFNIASGALFGLWWGMVWSMLGGTVGSVACFLIARTGARGWLEKKLSKLPRFEHFDAAVGEDGSRLVFLLRLSPIVPLAPVSYALGLSRVKLRHFLLTTPAMIPSMLPFVYTGDIARSLVAVLRGNVEKPWWEWALLIAGLVATVLAAWLLTRKAKQALEARRSAA